MNDILQSGLVVGSSCGTPDEDGGGEDALNVGCVEVHYRDVCDVMFSS